MKIYLASGFTIMNIKDGEKKLIGLGNKNRLVSYNDVINTSNKVLNTINYWGKYNEKNKTVT